MVAPPYIRRLDRVDGVWVWRVDGHRIRDWIDVEFTNGHHHFTRPYIPVDEIWIDREAEGESEWQFWALRQRIERALMAGGMPYLKALAIGARIERQERRLARGLTKKPPYREIRLAARRRRLGEIGGREVWLVDGRAVRDLAYVDFTQGGHGYRYRFIPKSEIWIDDAVRPSERPAVLHHEAVEVALMAGGMKYEEAHARASRSEILFRRRGARRALAGDGLRVARTW